MSLGLFIVGGLALVAGVGMIGFGIPINEFSFGNTLILAGTSAAVGGLIIIGLGAVVAQLRQLVEGVNTVPMKPGPDLFEALPVSQTETEAMSPFSRKSTTEPAAGEPSPAAGPVTPPGPFSESLAPAPTLRNPDVVGEEEPAPKPRSFVPPLATESRRPWRVTTPIPAEAPPERTHSFDSGWRAPEPKAAKPAADAEVKSEPKLGPEPREESPARKDFMPPPRVSEPRAVAILKSGVVDGMGYTLYVDGSIEADLPQGTVRFASINELRSYLEKSG
jgi:hypothetical protein